MQRTRRYRFRRGLTILEMMLAASMMLFVIIILADSSSMINYAYERTLRVTTTDLTAQMAMARIAPEIRAARSVTGATSSMVTLQMPSYDSSGNLVLPMTNGHTYAYYLSNTTGSTSATGNILWRSVDGTPDSTWALEKGKGVSVLSSLSFSYPYADAVTVTVGVTKTSGSALRAKGTQTDTFTNTQDVLLRNYGL